MNSDKKQTAVGMFCGLALASLLFIGGCQSGVKRAALTTPAPVTPTPAETGTLVENHGKKDNTVTDEADNIDRKVAGSAVANDVKVSTDAQRAAVAGAPAAEIAAMLARYEAAVAAFNTVLAEKDRLIAEQAKQITRLQDAEMRATASSLRKWGVSLILVGVAVAVALKAIPLGAAVGGVGFLLVSAAQVYVKVASHPWFDRTVAALIVAAVVGIGAAVWHAYKKGDLTKKALRERDRMRSVLTEVVPALDELKAEFGEKLLPWLSKLKGRMDWDDRQLVKDVRREVEKDTV